MRKKEIFPKMKKDGFELFVSTSEMQIEMGITAFSMDGVFIHEPYACSKLYSVRGISDTKLFSHFLKELRGMDVCIQMQVHKQNSDNLMLALYIYDEEMGVIYNRFAQLEEKIGIMCNACNYTYQTFDFESRMKYVFSEITDGVRAMGNREVPAPEAFFSEDTSWMDELSVDSRFDFFSELAYRGNFHAPEKRNGFFKICYIKKITDFRRPESFSSIFLNEKIRSLGVVLEPVSDFGQSVRFHTTYLDYEAPLARMRRKTDPRLKTLTHFSDENDSKEYMLYGCIFVIAGSDQEDVEDTYNAIKEELGRCGIVLNYIFGADLFGRFLESLPAGLNIQNYPLRQVHSDQVSIPSFSLYLFKREQENLRIDNVESEETVETVPYDNSWLEDAFV